jgi:uncharacterized protein
MHAIWIEIPASDLGRAKAFYESVFGHAATDETADGTRRITIIEGTPTVSLNETAGFRPSLDGSIPYFHVDEPVSGVLERVVASGGKILEPAAARGDLGVFSLVADSEGNSLYLHATR